MGIFSRFSEIINSNINSMLEKAENPEKMIRLMIHEMEDTLTEVKSSAAEVVADRIRLTRTIKVEQAREQDWDKKAQIAVNKGREDLAREALEQKMEATRKVQAVDIRLQEIEELVKQYQTDITRLEEKLANARSRQTMLIANHRSAVTRRRVEEKIYRINTSGAFARFEQLEKRIDQYQAEAEVTKISNSSLDQKFQDLVHSEEVDNELQLLKNKMGQLSEKKKQTKQDNMEPDPKAVVHS